MYSSKGSYSWEITEITHKDQNGGMYRLTKYNVDDVEIYSYGFLTHSLKTRPGHGGEWSSNCQNINTVFGLDLTEIGMDGISAAIDIDKLKYMLGVNYKVVEYTFGHEVLSVDDSVHKNHEWVTL